MFGRAGVMEQLEKPGVCTYRWMDGRDRNAEWATCNASLFRFALIRPRPSLQVRRLGGRWPTR